MKDSSDDATRKRKQAVPGVIGIIMNIIREVNCTDSGIFSADSVNRKVCQGFARLSGINPVCILANTAIVIQCTELLEQAPLNGRQENYKTCIYT